MTLWDAAYGIDATAYDIDVQGLLQEVYYLSFLLELK